MLLTDERTRAAYAEGAGIYRIVPAAVAIPRSPQELVDVVRWAGQNDRALVPRGAGSGMPGGNVGRDVVVDLSQGFDTLTVNAEARTAWAGASVTWDQVTRAARPFGLRLPPDPSSGAFATCGGMAMTNAAGPRTVRYGSVRGWIEALEVVGADGESRTVRRGGGASPRYPVPDTRYLRHFPKTRKSSSGYALDRYAESGDEVDLLIGSEGTLAIVTAVHWRLEPIPPDRAGAALGFADLSALGEAVPYLLSLDPSAVELLDASLLRLIPDAPRLEALLLVEFERENAAAARGVVGDAVRGLKRHLTHVETAVDRPGLEKLWEIRRLASPALARLPPSQRSLQVIEDGCVPVERLGDYVAALRAAAERHGIAVAIFGHAGDGHVHVNALPDTTRSGWEVALQRLFDDVLGHLIRLGGVPAGEHGVGRLRAGILERFYGAEVLARFRDVKRAYDPRSILNPGVILPAADWAPLAALKVGAGAAPIPEDIAARLREVERTAGWATPKLELAR